MTRRPVIFHPAVVGDLAEIYSRYAEMDPVLPARFERRMDEQLRGVELFPDAGAIVFESYRRLLIKRFPYMAVYRVCDDRIEVLAVVNIHRAPEWIESTVSGRA